ncbi:MAG TPA: class I SAM-dependent methyltransferase [Hanamia sp.]|nr:class I SAM-dependent methyltransferase [Hanamia sp.]
MDRIKLIKFLLSRKKSKHYLEIGVFSGHVFFKIKSTFKIAVDPAFQFSFFRKLIKTLLNPSNFYNKYFSKTSDQFFKENAANLFALKKIDVALIDGMHEHDFALRDVENTLKYLDDDGIIIMHDCNPLKKEATISFREWKAKGMEGTWNGDTWKTIIYLRSLRKDINVFVLDCDHGLGIITKRKSGNMLNFSPEEISHLTYEQFNENKNHWINLKNADYIFEYLQNAKII